MQEIWAMIVYDGIKYENYEISTYGRVKNKKTGKILKHQINSEGYCCIWIKKKGMKIHRLVAQNFILNIKNKPQVNHIDTNKQNNNIENLEWVTNSENMKHAFNNNLLNIQKGASHVFSKLTEEDVIFIKNNYIPRDKIFGGASLGRKFGVGQNTISNIINGKIWKHV